MRFDPTIYGFPVHRSAYGAIEMLEVGRIFEQKLYFAFDMLDNSLLQEKEDVEEFKLLINQIGNIGIKGFQKREMQIIQQHKG